MIGKPIDYRTLFEHLTSGCAYCRMLCVEGIPRDFVFLDVNKAFNDITGLTNVVGRHASEVAPEMLTSTPRLFEVYGRIAANKTPERFEVQIEFLHVWLSISLSCPETDCFLAVFEDITQRRLTEEALRRERSLVSSIMETSPAGIVTVDATGNITYANATAVRILGLTKEEISARTYNAPSWRITAVDGGCFPNEQLPFVRVMSSGKPVYDVRHAILWPDGRLVILSVNAVPTKDDHGNTIGMVSTVADITEHLAAETALRVSEARYRTLFTEMLEGFALHEIICNDQGTPIDYRFLSINPAFERLTGFRFSDTVGKTVLQILPDTESHWIETYGKVALTGEPTTFENYSRELDRHYRVVAFCPQPGQFAVIFSDITERKRAELLLSQEKERLAVTLRSIGDGVITTDTSGNVVLLNKVAESMTGWKTQEAVGRPLSEVFRIVNELTREPRQNPVEAVLSTGSIVELANHTCLISRDGREMVIADSGAPIRDSASRIIGVVLVFRDTTEKQKLNDSLQRAQKLESLGVLAGGIAHDFNNLLAGIFGYIDMASESVSSGSPEKAKRHLTKAITVFDRARALTHQLLTFSKGGAPIRTTAQLPPIVKHSAQFALSGSNISCEFAVADDLWACDCDANQIGQVIDNIVINAKQAMPLGGSIMLSGNNVSLEPGHCPAAGRAGRFVRISVRDQGIGMPREIISRIFDPFFSTKETGHGLGLATVYSIVQRHDGWIDVESEPGKGSTFNVYLPATAQSSTAVDGRHHPEHQGGGTLLVMDDEDFMREIVSEMLRSMGYSVVEARNGDEALRLAQSAQQSGTPIAAAILDLTVPGGMGGKEAVAHIQRLWPDIVAIASSGYSEDPIMARPTDHGFNGKIVKPFRKHELSELLARLL